jgi:hypothetical protein
MIGDIPSTYSNYLIFVHYAFFVGVGLFASLLAWEGLHQVLSGDDLKKLQEVGKRVAAKDADVARANLDNESYIADRVFPIRAYSRKHESARMWARVFLFALRAERSGSSRFRI